LLAATLQAVLPPLPVGYLYAGNGTRGLIPMGVMVVGSTLLLVETVEILDWTQSGEKGELMWLGLGLTLGGYVFGIVDAASVARDTNARLRAGRAAFRVVPAPSGFAVTATVPFG
jgi:hypothetical protein